MSEMKTVQFTGGTAENASVDHPPLTDWVNEPKVVDLKNDFEVCKWQHDSHVSNVMRWRDLMASKPKETVNRNRGRSQVQPKLIRRQAEWRYSALSEPFLSSKKLFDVQPVTFEDEASAKQNALLLNWQFRTKLDRVRFIDEYVRTNVDEGSSVVRIGWERLTKKVKEMVPEYEHVQPEDEQQVQALEQAIMLKQQDPRSYNEQVPEEVRASVDFYEENGQSNVAYKIGEKEVEVEKVIINRPTLGLIMPENVYIDPSCNGDLDKAKYVVISFETSKADLKKEPDRYKNLDLVNWEDSSIVATTDHATNTPQTFNFRDSLRKRIVAYEYWGLYDIDKNDTLVPIVATWVGSTMIRMEKNPFPDEKPPIVVSNYMPIKRQLMGEPDAELLEDNQNILGAITRGMIDLLGRSANSQQGFAKGALDVLNRRKFEAGQDYEFNPNMQPNTAYIMHQYPEIPTSAYNMLQLQNQEAEALTGVKSFSGGMSGEAYGDVAAGIRGVLDAASKREMGILRRLAKGITDIGVKIIAMNAEFLTEKEVIRVTNTEFVEINREDLPGNFDLQVDISTAEVDNAKATDLGFMLQTIGNNMDLSMVQIILSEIAELKRMPALAEKIRRFAPQPDPMAEKVKELEILKLQTEIEKIKSDIQKNQADTAKKYAEADQQGLETIEQEKGVKHERDMEKQKGQSEGNQNLAITKALVTPRKSADGSQTAPLIDAAIGFNELAKRMPRGNERMSGENISNDPSKSLGSKYFDPSADPSLNPGFTL